jgi:hypothetical protein
MATTNFYIGQNNPGQQTDTALTTGSSSTSSLNVELRIQTTDGSTATNITHMQVELILRNILRYLKRGGLTNFTNAHSGTEVLPLPAPNAKTYSN